MSRIRRSKRHLCCTRFSLGVLAAAVAVAAFACTPAGDGGGPPGSPETPGVPDGGTSGGGPDARRPADAAPTPDARPRPDAGPTPDASTQPSCIPLPLDDSTDRFDGGLSAVSPFWSTPESFSCDGSGDVTFGQPYYDAFVFCNTGPSRTFRFIAMTSFVDPFSTPFGTLSDPTLYLYDGVGIPDDPTTCVAADDNSANTSPTHTIPFVGGIQVPNGAVFTVVVSSKQAGDTGTFELWVGLDD